MRFLSDRQDPDPAEAAQQHQREEYRQAITRLIQQARAHEPDVEMSRNGPCIRRAAPNA